VHRTVGGSVARRGRGGGGGYGLGRGRWSVATPVVRISWVHGSRICASAFSKRTVKSKIQETFYSYLSIL